MKYAQYSGPVNEQPFDQSLILHFVIAYMFVPHGTDAPIYHVPAVTITVIILNSGIFFAPPLVEHFQNPEPSDSRNRLPVLTWIVEGGGYDGPEDYKLQYGEGIKPWQGITASFLHAHAMHLVGNMVFLLLFGIIVEGKIGWWKFLPIYFGVALIRGIFLQATVMVFNPGFHAASIGASGVIFAIMAIALIWAPMNNIEVTHVGWRYRTTHEVEEVDVPVYAMAGVFIVIDLFISYAIVRSHGTFAPFTPVLHTSGAMMGAAIGIAMVKFNWVDCENYDIFSVWAGRHEKSRDELNQQSGAKSEATLVQQGLEQIRQILDGGKNPQMAYRAHVSMAEKYDSWHLPEREFLTIIKQLSDQQRDNDAVLAMEEYLKANRPKLNQVRLKLASLLLERMDKPNQSLRVLASVSADHLNERERAIYRNLEEDATQAKNAGVHDSLDDW
ncbi:rhomboid family intramembrane serine protease [Bremerella sp. P1]|uniref:rhomboid family intramembrane serine protease n=1 Tax=Bremerella sp. P1 TaxID=3026424 RepID=UPI002367D9BA|nr:rhomboid family intramembrane serine protease [Bremerella sp. P1]WDI42439.1 rhomboid family intramembrane serine protease [Bremerella sp. P1]